MPNYNYGGYPYGMPYQPYTPQPNQQSNMYQQQPQLNQYAFVNGIEGAKAYPIMPNQSLMLMDSDNPVCYMKTSDTTGKATLKCYKLVEVPEKELINDPIRDDINNINKRIDDLVKLIEEKNNA